MRSARTGGGKPIKGTLGLVMSKPQLVFEVPRLCECMAACLDFLLFGSAAAFGKGGWLKGAGRGKVQAMVVAASKEMSKKDPAWDFQSGPNAEV